MQIKNYLLLSTLIGWAAFFSNSANAQNETIYKSAGYDVTDTSLIPARRLEQQRDFIKSQYDFPSKPRNQWEIGVNVGAFNVSGDVRSKHLFTAKNPLQTLGFGLHVRKAWGHVISTRLQFIHGTASGYNWQSATGYWAHSNPWNKIRLNGVGYATGNIHSTTYSATPVYYNYKTNIDELSFQMVATLNNIKFHRARNKASLYALVGMGGMLYDTWINAINGSGTNATLYDFQSITSKFYPNTSPNANWPNGYRTRKAKNADLLKMFDGTYETAAERHDNRPWFGKERTFRTIITAGLGVQFKLGSKVSLSIEEKFSLAGDDLLDGQRWQEYPQPGFGGSAMTRDNDTYNYLSLGLNVHIGRKSIEPLWWMNPLDYSYTKMNKPTIGGTCDVDKDGDGVSDCFDRCSDTPAGVAVDTHGCAIDTDGDGVPDFKDKQLITPTECQPADADGIGTCPDPECCSGKVVPIGCGGISGGAIEFNSGKSKLDAISKAALASLSTAMRANPSCKVLIVGNGNVSKIDQQRSWDRVNAVINYLVDNQGIDRERFIFQYGQNGNSDAVIYRSAVEGEEGPSNMPPPFPNLRRD